MHAAARSVRRIAGTLTELGTNAPGFVAHDWYYQAALTATWSFELTRVGDIKFQDAAVDVTVARELRTTLAACDAIHREWNTVAASERRCDRVAVKFGWLDIRNIVRS